MRLHHLALRTRDVDPLVAFYRRWLALRVIRDNRPRSVWLQGEQGATVLMIEQAEPHEPQPPAGTRDLIATAVNAPTRTRLRTDLAEAGLLEDETEHTLYFRDPDGRRLGISSHPL
ncbi:MAG: VOC family protein [Myxococcota bacterium]